MGQACRFIPVSLGQRQGVSLPIQPSSGSALLRLFHHQPIGASSFLGQLTGAAYTLFYRQRYMWRPLVPHVRLHGTKQLHPLGWIFTTSPAPPDIENVRNLPS